MEESQVLLDGWVVIQVVITGALFLPSITCWCFGETTIFQCPATIKARTVIVQVREVKFR
jgi:hypothetical protein